MENTYQRPAIEDLGTLADITLGSGGLISDIAGIGVQGIGGSNSEDPGFPGNVLP